MSYRSLGTEDDIELRLNMSSRTKVAIGVGAFAVLSGLGYLLYRYPTPSFGSGGDSGVFFGFGRRGTSPSLSIRANARRRKRGAR